jgi:protocatechuate 3,4-dioxygenase beta subunit
MRGAAASIAILCLRALAQEPACAIGGTVVDGATNKPVARARVIAEVQGSYSFVTLTDAGGNFCFEHLTPATYHVLVQKPGYTETRNAGTLAVEEGAAIKPLAIRLTPYAGLAGVVLDEDGSALAGVEVTVWERVRDRKGGSPDSVESVETDGLGAFRFSELDPGTYYLSAKRPDDLEVIAVSPFLDSTGQAPREKEVETFYSGSFTFASATPVEVKAGQQVGNLVLTLKKTRLRSITGKVANPPRAGFLDLERETETESSFFRAVVIGEDGSFSRMGLLPARYTLSLRDGPRLLASKEVDLTSGDAIGITLDPVETVDVTVTFRTEGKGPAYRPGADFLIAADRLDVPVQTEADGTCRFVDVPRGIYSVSLSTLAQKLYVKRMVYGGEVLEDRKLDLRNGASGTLEVTLSPNVAEVEGRVDGDGSAAITVILVKGTSITGLAETDQKGRFRMETLAPGKYRLFAIAGFDEDEWGSPDLAKALAGKSLELELQESEKKQVNAPVISEEEWDAAVAKSGG